MPPGPPCARLPTIQHSAGVPTVHRTPGQPAAQALGSLLSPSSCFRTMEISDVLGEWKDKQMSHRHEEGNLRDWDVPGKQIALSAGGTPSVPAVPAPSALSSDTAQMSPGVPGPWPSLLTPTLLRSVPPGGFVKSCSCAPPYRTLTFWGREAVGAHPLFAAHSAGSGGQEVALVSRDAGRRWAGTCAAPAWGGVVWPAAQTLSTLTSDGRQTAAWERASLPESPRASCDQGAGQGAPCKCPEGCKLGQREDKQLPSCGGLMGVERGHMFQ